MGWNHIPDTDSGATTSEDNPFAGSKLHTPGKTSVNLPTDEWLCRKMAKLNITLAQGYPTRTSEAAGLLRDQFVRPPKSQQKWYEEGLWPNCLLLAYWDFKTEQHLSQDSSTGRHCYFSSHVTPYLSGKSAQVGEVCTRIHCNLQSRSQF